MAKKRVKVETCDALHATVYFQEKSDLSPNALVTEVDFYYRSFDGTDARNRITREMTKMLNAYGKILNTVEIEHVSDFPVKELFSTAMVEELVKNSTL